MDLQENQSVQELLKLLSEHKPEKAQDFSALLFYVDSMERKFDAVVEELQTVKTQLSEMKDGQNPVKKALTDFVQSLESKVNQMRERLDAMKESIVQSATDMVANVKQMGISALDNTLSFLGVQEGLTSIRDSLTHAMQDSKAQIEKIETIGQELRSVGTHLKNVGRAATGKDLQPACTEEGKLQGALLAPLRTTHKVLVSMGNTTLAALGNVERLEQAAARGREQKPSIRQDLQTLKAQTDATKPPLDKPPKTQEAAL